ncbi:MAG: hypothetical protein H6735_28425 [Alphaproteobacteria bacterium]|nr:hypothetical protein [Alphaproteobacteria bacterium]
MVSVAEVEVEPVPVAGIDPPIDTPDPSRWVAGGLPVFVPEPMDTVPLLGGTMEAAADLGGVIAADPDGDRLIWWSPDTTAVERSVGEGSRPFRIEVADDTAWVTLRGTGEVAEVSLPDLEVRWRTPVCPEPRGLDRAEDGTLWVACAGGDLVVLDPSGSVDRHAVVAPDLRDVVVADGVVYLSRFRFGEVVLLDPETARVVDVAPLTVLGGVVWRMRPDPAGGGVFVAFHKPSGVTVTPSTGVSYYGTSDPCAERHQPSLARVTADGEVAWRTSFAGVVLGVDLAVDGDRILVVDAGAKFGRASLIATDTSGRDGDDGCKDPDDVVIDDLGLVSSVVVLDGEPIVQSYVPDALFSVLPSVEAHWGGQLPLVDQDPRVIFHRDASLGVACASCHPEGQDDGQVWRFGEGVSGTATAGRRRTLPLGGHLLDRAPYHWMGELEGPADLARSTYTLGMGGMMLPDVTSSALFTWLDGVRPVRASGEEPAGDGEALFGELGCTDCHAGPMLTDNDEHRVREDDPPFKTPSLVGLGLRTSFMHDGCAATLEDRFLGPDSCTGGALHGDVSNLSADELDTLIGWLRTR